MFFDSVRQIQVHPLSKRLNKNKKREQAFFVVKIGSIPHPRSLACFHRQNLYLPERESEDRETCRKEDWVALLSVSADGGGGEGKGKFNDRKRVVFFTILVPCMTAGVKP
jgi:hypothetical protein